MINRGSEKGVGSSIMSIDIIHDRGRGPEIVGTRITVYDLLPYFLEPDTTEAFICRIYDFLTPQQVAAARAYVLNHFEAVMAEHQRIEAHCGRQPARRGRAFRADTCRFREFPATASRAGAKRVNGIRCARNGEWRNRPGPVPDVPRMARPAGFIRRGGVLTCAGY